MITVFLVLSIFIVFEFIYCHCNLEKYINILHRDYFPARWNEYVYPFNWNYMGWGYPSVYDPKFSVPYQVDE